MIHTNIVMKRELTTVGKPEFQEVVLDMAKIDCSP
jgi:hypothetical protein